MKYEYHLLLFSAPSLSISERTNIEWYCRLILVLAKDGLGLGENDIPFVAER